MAVQPLTPQQQALIQVLLLREKIISKAAAQVGIPAKLAMGWMRLPHVRQTFLEARRDMTVRIITAIQAGVISEALREEAGLSDELLAAVEEHEKIKAGRSLLDMQDQSMVKEHLAQFLAGLLIGMHVPIEKLLVWQ